MYTSHFYTYILSLAYGTHLTLDTAFLWFTHCKYECILIPFSALCSTPSRQATDCLISQQPSLPPPYTHLVYLRPVLHFYRVYIRLYCWAPQNKDNRYRIPRAGHSLLSRLLIAKLLICFHGSLLLKRYFFEFPGQLTAKSLLKKQWFTTVMFSKMLNHY